MIHIVKRHQFWYMHFNRRLWLIDGQDRRRLKWFRREQNEGMSVRWLTVQRDHNADQVQKCRKTEWQIQDEVLRYHIVFVLKSGLQLQANGWSLISDVDQICAEREDLITHRRGWQWPWGRCMRWVEGRERVFFQVFPLPVPPVLAVVVHVVVVVVVVVMMASV